MLTLDQVKEYAEKQVSPGQYDDIIESDAVTEVENCGHSGINPYLIWHIVRLVDGTEINIYE